MVDNSKNKNDFNKRNIIMFSRSQKKVKRSFFSLIELLIVIGIMGALTALILPQFSGAEESAKDTGCDYNNAGTLRYVSMFKAANNVYPTGFHTGLEALGTTPTVREEVDVDGDGATTSTAMVTDTDSNFALGTTEALNANELLSLTNAGITKLAYGAGTAETASIANFVNKIEFDSGDWKDGDDNFMLNGKLLKSHAEDGISVIVPLFAAPTVDWEKTAEGADSVVQIALAGKCPWPADGHFRYYICFFKVFENGDAAKLIGTACPECGSLNPNAF